MIARILENYMQLYRLYQGFKTKDYRKMGMFVAHKGKKFGCQPIRLMIVGRATNGWDYYIDDKTEINVVNSVENALKAEDPFLNFYNDGDVLYTIDRIDGHRTDLTFPLWNYSKIIFEKITNIVVDKNEKWVDYICWSNLHKLAPARLDIGDNGNPSPKLQFLQMQVCRNILKSEIELFRPTHILFITGTEWFDEFNENDCCFTVLQKFGVNVNSGRNKNNVYAEQIAEFKLNDETVIPAVICCRPEYRDKEKYVGDVLTAFCKTLNNNNLPTIYGYNLKKQQQ